MSKREYIALSKKSDKKISMKYDFFGVLQEAKFFGEKWEEKQVSHAIRNLIPIKEESIVEAMERKDLPFEYRAVPEDLNFSAFWNLYAKKVGKIARTEKLWKALPDTEKSEILIFLETKFNLKYLGSPYKPYPETFLSNKMWLADKI